MPARSSGTTTYCERPGELVARVWAGTDIGKTHHYCVVIDQDGRRLLPRRVAEAA
jgi:hypothetical protein